jgi:hypothetical protein
MKPRKVLPKGPFATVPMCTVCQRNPERCNSDVAECSHIDCPHRSKAWGVCAVNPVPERKRSEA